MTRQPELVRTREDLRQKLQHLTGSRALVMTMGALHAGHLQLVKEAKGSADHVVVTIFVNPTQFAPGEDFDAYPRTLDADLEALADVGADLVWAPQPEDVYPTRPVVSIDPGPIARVLEGKTRPTHFAGVALVCTKVINLVRPDIAFYGQKDAQQLAMLRTVLGQLDVPVEVRAVETVRDADGVALSSRNQYLSDNERARARALSRSLRAGVEAAESGSDPAGIVKDVLSVLRETEGIDVDYVAVVDDASFDILAGSDSVDVQGEGAASSSSPETPEMMTDSDNGRAIRILVAAKVATTRLIDNMGATLTTGENTAERGR
ncbi:pantoate--beta-alanine ligase [Schaalia sp. ZJ405]|uniref:pantoate--beta-alanine ligase n=1 Tax=Schaalia sp. ZJ405 TaxID=2709403 RepID=UPI0013EDC255|nr:pantoate--beta-alanine ligase [Schaalia sp. ZJ405]QPK81036.1 pantoate--beta-alanine ligase [Schaalia sp. ZJ405]